MAGCNQWLPHLFFGNTGEKKCAFKLLGLYRAFERKFMYLVCEFFTPTKLDQFLSPEHISHRCRVMTFGNVVCFFYESLKIGAVKPFLYPDTLRLYMLWKGAVLSLCKLSLELQCSGCLGLFLYTGHFYLLTGTCSGCIILKVKQDDWTRFLSRSLSLLQYTWLNQWVYIRM